MQRASLAINRAAGPFVYRPDGDDRNRAHWRINGFAATIVVWTAEEWERLEIRPRDAQYIPCGISCALRMDEP